MPRPALSYEDLLNLVESGKELAAQVDLNQLLQNILSRATGLTNSAGASVLLMDERKNGLYFAAVKGEDADTILATFGEASSERVPLDSKAGKVLLSGESLVEVSLVRDQGHFKGVDSKTGTKTDNLVCAAMAVNDAGSMKRLGVLQIINKQKGEYTERDRILLEHFAAQAGIAIRNSKVFSNLVAHMGFYANRDALEIMKELNQPPRSERLSVMFADLRGFTRLCQTVGNEQTICDLLSEFMTMLADTVLSNGGMVNKKLGDGILALFRQPNAPRNAVTCAFRMEDAFQGLRRTWAARVPEKLSFLDIGIGIVTAPVMLGSIGTGNMRDFTAIGKHVILAAAFEKEARNGKRILGDKETYFAVRDLVEEADPEDFPLHKPDQPTITSYDQYHLTRRKKEAAAVGSGRAAMKVFLCHASEDKPRVRQLCESLSRDGVNAWLDENEIAGGEDWEESINQGARSCHVALVCLSPVSVAKAGFLQKEIRRILDIADEKPEGIVYAIPVRLEDCKVPQSLMKRQCVNLFEQSGYEKLLEALRRASNASR